MSANVAVAGSESRVDGGDARPNHHWRGAGAVAVVATTPSFEQRLHALLTANGGPSLVRWPAGPGESNSQGVSVAFVGPDMPLDAMVTMAEAIDREHPEVCVVLVAEPSPQVFERAIRAGVRDVLAPGAGDREITQVLGRAIDTAGRRRMSGPTGTATDEGPKRRIVTVLSPKGGVGKTFVSTNLSVALGAVMPNEVAVVDLDLQFGDIASALRILPEHTVTDAAHSALRSDATVVKVFLSQHESGVYALCAPDDPAEADEISYEQSSHLVRLLSSSFPIVLVDTAAGLDPHTLAVAEISTDLVFVCSVDVASVRSLRKEIDALDRLGMTAQRRHLVLNRIDAPGGARPEDVEVAVGLDATISVPTDRTVLTAANQGTPLLRHDPKSPIAKKFVAFAETFAGVPAPSGSKPVTLLPWRRSR